MTTPDETLAKRIRKARKLRGWSQKELAKKVGASERQVMRWEHTDDPQYPDRHREKLIRQLRIEIPERPAPPTPNQLRLQELADEFALLRSEFEAFARLVTRRLEALENPESSSEANGHQRGGSK